MTGEDLTHVKSSIENYENRATRLIVDSDYLVRHIDEKNFEYGSASTEVREKIKYLQKESNQIRSDIVSIQLQIKNLVLILKHLVRDSDIESLNDRIDEFGFDNLATRDYLIRLIEAELKKQ